MNADSWEQTAQPGTALGSYRIERRLGRGGMGAVFLAYDTTLRRALALEVLDESGDAATSRGRLLREARTAAALNQVEPVIERCLQKHPARRYQRSHCSPLISLSTATHSTT